MATAVAAVQALAAGLRHNLELEGYTVDIAGDGMSGLERMRSQQPDLVILDLMLPGTHGFDVLESRRRAASPPVMEPKEEPLRPALAPATVL